MADVIPPVVPTPATVPTSETITDSPAKALDPIAGGDSILDKARDLAKPYLEQVDKTTRPYVEKVHATTKPYTDAARAKGKEFVDYIEGTNAPPLEGVETVAPGSSVTTADKARGLFDHGISSIQSTFTHITSAIDTKTASGDKPGLYTQVTTAVHKNIEKVMGDVPPSSSVPAVQTTTNTVPHTDASDP